MTTALLLAGLLALGAMLALWRLRHAPARGSRKAALLLLQPLCAGLLYLALMPPSRPGDAGTLVVATAGSDAAALAAAAGDAVVALPEAPPLPGIARVPDLGTALRRHPGSRALRIVGDGLPARDRDTAAGLPLAFAAPAEHAGLAELSPPPLLVPGAAFQVAGRVSGIADARVELRDPSGARVDLQPVGRDGRFALHGASRAAGETLFELRVADGAGRERDHVDVPVVSMAAPAQRVLLLGGAPQPEWKYLRRWAEDAGLQVQARIAVGGGVQLGDADVRLDAASLDQLDLLIVDERALTALSRTQRDALAAAVERGLGMLVRLGGPLDGGQRATLAALGLAMRGDDGSAPLRLTAALDPAPADNAAAGSQAPPWPALQQRALHPQDVALPVLARDAAGDAYAWWRAQGRGRIGLTTLVDSYRLVLEGHGGDHAALWSALASPLVRAQPRTVTVAAPAWRGERTTLCAPGKRIDLRAPDGGSVALLRDDAGCAALWPRHAGWYRWHADDGRSGMLFVRDPQQALHANAMRAATLALVRGATPTAAASHPQPGPRWPWWLAFVLAAGCSWWLERRRPTEPR